MAYLAPKIALMFRIVYLPISIYILAILSCACSVKKEPETRLPYYNTPDFTPLFLTAAPEIAKRITHSIPPFSLTDQHGENITEKHISDKIHVANFILTSCGKICPIMTNHLKLLQQEFKANPEVVLLSYSVTPWLDSVSRLQEYAQNNQITSPNWHLLTGSKSQIYNLARRAYFAEEDLGFAKDSTEFLHTEHMVLVDKNQRIRGIYNGTLQLEAEQLIKDIKVLLKEEIL